MHQSPGLICAAHAATSMAFCKQISVLPLSNQCRWTSTRLWSCVQTIRDSIHSDTSENASGVRSVSTRVYVPNKLHFSGCQINYTSRCARQIRGKQRIRNRSWDWQIALSKCGVRHDVDQYCQLCPSVSGERTFAEDVSRWLCCVDVFDLNHWVK